MKGSRASVFWIGCAIMVSAVVGAASHASAQSNYGANNNGLDGRLTVNRDAFQPTNPIDAPSREYMGLPIGGWMVYAGALTGIVWDDNVFQAATNEESDWGYRLRPSLEMVYNNGIHNTTVYGLADARFYGDDSDADVINAQGGVRHIWEVQRDLVVRMEVGATRGTDMNNAGNVLTPTGLQTIVSPLDYYSFSGSTSFLRTMGSIFFGGAVSANYTSFDDVTDSLGRTIEQDQRDQEVYTFTGRAGIWISPVFYTFVEPQHNIRRFREDAFDSEGQRIVAGIGSDRISLFRGEIYGGYQRQDYDAANIATVEGGVFGGRLFWSPTRDWLVTLEADRSLGDSTLRAAGNPNGSPVESTTVGIRADYILADIWALAARAGYTYTDFTETGREDDQFVAGTTLTYFVWRNLAATLDWQHITLDSNVEGNSFERNIFTLGATYKY